LVLRGGDGAAQERSVQSLDRIGRVEDEVGPDMEFIERVIEEKDAGEQES
jgi:hypothetical protein